MTSLPHRLLRSALFCLPPEPAHEAAIWALKQLGRREIRKFIGDRFSVDSPALKTTIGWLTFPNPVGLAAGFDKNGEALEGLEALGFGFMEAGTLTPKPQPGNPKPRLFRLPKDQGIVNRLGFNNVGAEAVAKRFAEGVPLNVPLGFNIGKFKGTPLEEATADYVQCLELLYDWAEFFVVNVSSPNTPGLRELQAPEDLDPLLRALQEKNEELAGARDRMRPPLLFVKISPDEDFIEDTVAVAARRGFSGIVATNTTRSREGLSGPAPADGGLSGRPLRARSTEVIRRLYRASGGRLAIIGVGGIFSAEDAYEKILAGASLVEVYTGFVYQGLETARDINRGLLQLLRRDGYESVAQAVGKESAPGAPRAAAPETAAAVPASASAEGPADPDYVAPPPE